ncbi:hypothetical protein [Nocardia cyriacigeorgica]|uniref:hypothetical protein n=1 Tax=Nocardia cyriacigeorgica TaxID=135487 RepID=UPI002456B066|nr:hypothetical protein [Nocardia cyriacigeorgica]
MSDLVRQVEAVLADLLETWADMREQYISGAPGDYDYHNLNENDRALANEVGGIRQAARLVRGHRDVGSCSNLPARLWRQWGIKEMEASGLLAALDAEHEARHD